MTVIAGVKSVIVDGVSYDAKESGKYNLGGFKAESLTGGQGRVGRMEKPVVAFIEADIFLDESQTPADLNVRGKTVVLSCHDRNITVSAADLVSDADVDQADRSLTVRFEGRVGTEVAF